MFSRIAVHAAQYRGALSRIPNSSSIRGISAAGSVGAVNDEHPPVQPVSIQEYKRFNPSEWFSDVDDPSVRKELSRIRSLEDDAIAQVSKEIPAIDWDKWRSKINTPGVVDEIKAAHDSIEVPSVVEEQKRLQKEVIDAFAPIIKEAEELAIEADKSAKELQMQLEEYTYLNEKLSDLTIDEVLERFPQMKKEIEDDIANNRWLLS